MSKFIRVWDDTLQVYSWQDSCTCEFRDPTNPPDPDAQAQVPQLEQSEIDLVRSYLSQKEDVGLTAVEVTKLKQLIAQTETQPDDPTDPGASEMEQLAECLLNS